jgi:CxxC motif-containing protein
MWLSSGDVVCIFCCFACTLWVALHQKTSIEDGHRLGKGEFMFFICVRLGSLSNVVLSGA